MIFFAVRSQADAAANPLPHSVGHDQVAQLPPCAGGNLAAVLLVHVEAAGEFPVRLVVHLLADEHGTLDGKQIDVHHLVATIAGTQTNLFAGPDNQLLQAELPQEGFALVRKGFVLTPPAKAPAPAPEPAQTAPGAQVPEN